jgi:hypothetical protein
MSLWYVSKDDASNAPYLAISRDDIPANIFENSDGGYTWMCWAMWPGTYDDPPEWDVVATGTSETLEIAKIEVEHWWKDVQEQERLLNTMMQDADRAADDGYFNG